MIWNGSADLLHEVRKLYPSAVIYAMQTKCEDGSFIFDMMHGKPVLVIEEKRKEDTTEGWLFEIGQEIVL